MISLEDYLKKDVGTRKLVKGGWRVKEVIPPTDNKPIEIEIISPLGRVYVGNRSCLRYEEHADDTSTQEAFLIAGVVEEYYARYRSRD